MYDQIANRLLASGNCLGVVASGLSPYLTAEALVAQHKAKSRIEPIVILVNYGRQTGDDDSDDKNVAQSTLSGIISLSGETLNRDQLYVKGGVFSVTSRVFLSDLLCRKVAPELISMVIIFRGQEIGDNSNELFGVRLFREKNLTGNLIVLSNKPHAIISKIPTLVSEMFLSDIVVIPRFHDIVQTALSNTDLSLYSMESALTVRQRELQGLIVAIVENCLIEIKKTIVGDLISSTTGRELLKDKSFSFRRKIDPVWMKLSWATRQIISDLSIFRKLVVLLEEYDPVSFLAFLQSQQELSGQTSPWWLSEDAQRMIRVARDRATQDSIEVPPKWGVVESILSPLLEIYDGPLRVLVLTQDEHQKLQVENFLEYGKEKSLLQLMRLHAKRSDLASLNEIETLIDSVSESSWSERRRPNNELGFVFQTGVGNSEDLMNELSVMDPQVVIMMQPNLAALRSLEIHTFLNNKKIAIYLIESEDAICESKFPELVLRENEAFDELIKSRKSLNFHSKNELGQIAKQRALLSVEAAGSSSRQGGSKRVRTVADLIRQTILVDTRELRSALPFVLYKKHLDLVPSTLSIGDYVLSRDICIERKSVTGNDLQQSLISGRLYKQLVNMTHAFAWPFLLLEFSTGKSFQLQSSETSSGEINPGSLIAQVIAILMHFPTLRLVWSPSFLFTANVFTRLKVGREQPRIDQGEPDISRAGPSVCQKRAIEFLKACPGITASNLPRILKQVSSIRGLISMEEEELIALMGKRDGHLFLRFLDQAFN